MLKNNVLLNCYIALNHCRGVAQLASALDLGSRGRGFESLHPDHCLRQRYNLLCGLVAQLVRALPCHGRGRGFETLLGRQFLCFYKEMLWDFSSVG